nr:glycosyltransferase [Oscillatoria sp. Prado101]
MTHFGILCPPATGHLNPMTTLGRELKLRGDRVTLFGIPDALQKTQAAGLEFWAIGESEFPAGFMAESLGKVGKLSGLAAGQYTLSLIQQGAAMLLRDAPKALKAAGVEALLVDQTTGEGGTVADFLGIPFITVYSALIVNQEDSVPPFFTSWSYNPVWWARLRNRACYGLLTLFTQPIRQVINEYRQQWKLPLYSHPSQNFSKLAQLSQQPPEFEFPRQHLPECFHFTGPYHNPAGRQPVSFPFEKLTGQPLIYASMGTVQNRLLGIFKSMAEACVGLDVQLVISLGGSTHPESLQGLPGNPLVVGYAPQLELLQKARITITHAGLNTALESLSNGVPIVAIPIANDQPGVAARIAWTGAGEFVPLQKLSVPKLRTAIQRVLAEDSYKKNAGRLQEAIRRSGGVSRAADIIEQVISTG